jgi:opacity protein-like surface antigen
MKKIKYLAIASTAVAAMPAFAQSKNFEGSNLSLGVGSIQLKESSDSTSKNWNTGGNIEFTKFKALDDSWLIGFGIGYDVGTLDSKQYGSGSGGIQYFDAFSGQSADGTDINDYAYQSGEARKQIKLKNNFSLSLLPAYTINKSTMIFGRASINRAKVSSNMSGVSEGAWVDLVPFVSCPDVSIDACNISSGSGVSGTSGSKYLNGLGWGFGLRHKFTENLFLQAEYKYVSYKHNAELDVKPKTQGYTLSIGYKF